MTRVIVSEVHTRITIHSIVSGIRRVETIIADETKAFRSTRFGISHNLIKKYLKRKEEGGLNLGGKNCTKSAKSIKKQLFINFRIEITHEQVGSDFHSSFILRSLDKTLFTFRFFWCRYFVNFNRFSIKLNHVHDFDSIVSIIFSSKFNESVALRRVI